MANSKKQLTQTLPMMNALESRVLFSVGPLDTGSGPLTGKLGGKLPFTAIAGQNPKIQQNLLITNSSNDPLSGNVTADLFLSADGAVDSSSIPIGTQGAFVVLRPFDQFALHYKVTSTPITTPAGKYQVAAQITDPDGNVTEVFSTLTIAISPPSIDLNGVFATAPKIGKNGKTRVSFTLTNSGSTTAAGELTYNVNRSVDANLSDATYITNDLAKINLKGGKSKKITANIPLPAGTYDLVIQLDPSNAFDDTNTGNNVFSSGPITVG